MKKLLLLVIMTVLGLQVQAQIVSSRSSMKTKETKEAKSMAGTMAVGTQLGYAGYGDGYNPFGIGAKFQYGLTDAFRGELSYNYWFPKDKVGSWDANLNFHYLVDLADNMKVYPLAGVTLVGFHGDNVASDKPIGFNVGAGIQYMVSQDIFLFAEAKYQSAKKTVTEEITAYGYTAKYEYDLKASGPVINVGFTVAF